MSDANAQPAGGPPAPGGDGGQPAGAQPNANQQPAGNQPAAPQPGNEPAAKPDAGPAPVAYEPTNNVGLDMALEFIGGLGIGPEDPAMKAAMEGNFDALEAMFRGMGDRAKGFERFLALGKSAYEGFSKEQKEKAAQAQAAIHDVVGGETRWKAIEAWAKQNAEPAERDAVNAALGQGGIVARATAFYLNHRFSQAAGTTVEPAERVTDPASGGGRGNGGNGPLSPQEYTQAVTALRKQLGGKFEGSPQYAQLQQRRRAYRG